METIVMIVSKAGYNNRGQLFTPRLAGHSPLPLCKPTVQPLLDGCRALIADGFDPKLRIVMRYEGSTTDALISTVGAAAKLTVSERADGKADPCFAPWIPFSIRRDEQAGPDIPTQNEKDEVPYLDEAAE